MGRSCTPASCAAWCLPVALTWCFQPGGAASLNQSRPNILRTSTRPSVPPAAVTATQRPGPNRQITPNRRRPPLNPPPLLSVHALGGTLLPRRRHTPLFVTYACQSRRLFSISPPL